MSASNLPTPDSVLLERSRSLLAQLPFSECQLLSGTRNILDIFRQEPRLQSFRDLIRANSESLLNNVRALLTRFHNQPELMFNPFVTSGFDPNEDQFSDTLADLLRPAHPHGFGKSFLLALLRASEPDAQFKGLRQHVTNLEKAVERSGIKSVHVKRNPYYPADESKPDIEIMGKGEAPFMVVIEKKLWNGSETITKLGVQTPKYIRWLKNKSKKRGVPWDHTLAIYLTPGRTSAIAPEFVALSCSELAHMMLDAIPDDAPTSQNCRILAKAFLLTYASLNGGL